MDSQQVIFIALVVSIAAVLTAFLVLPTIAPYSYKLPTFAVIGYPGGGGNATVSSNTVQSYFIKLSCSGIASKCTSGRVGICGSVNNGHIWCTNTSATTSINIKYTAGANLTYLCAGAPSGYKISNFSGVYNSNKACPGVLKVKLPSKNSTETVTFVVATSNSTTKSNSTVKSNSTAK